MSNGSPTACGWNSFDSGRRTPKIRPMHSTCGFTLAVLAAVAVGSGFPCPAADDYKLGPDSLPQEGVPRGEVTKYSWTNSSVYPGTTRDYWVYVPRQYDPNRPACVMVFQDGG